MDELEGLARDLAEAPRDDGLWGRLAQLVARGLKPPERLCHPEWAQAAQDRSWRSPAAPDLAELAAALRAAVRDADLVLATRDCPRLTTEDVGMAPPRPPPEASEPTAWPIHPGATRLVAGPHPDFFASLTSEERASDEANQARVWRWSTQEVIAEGSGPVAFSPDGRWVALGAGAGVRLLSLDPLGERSWRLGGLGAAPAALRFDAAGDLLVLAWGGVAAEVSPLDEEARPFWVRWPEPDPSAVSWTARGLVFQEGPEVSFTDPRGRVRVQAGTLHEPAWLAGVDPAGQGVVLEHAGRLETWSAGGRHSETLTWRSRLAGIEPLGHRLALSEPDRLYLHAPGAEDRTQPLRMLPGPPAPAAAFLAGGALQVLTAGGLLRRWTPADGRWDPPEDVRGFPGGVAGLARNSAGTRLGVRDGEGGQWTCDFPPRARGARRSDATMLRAVGLLGASQRVLAPGQVTPVVRDPSETWEIRGDAEGGLRVVTLPMFPPEG